jgi:hypothetical protein
MLTRNDSSSIIRYSKAVLSVMEIVVPELPQAGDHQEGAAMNGTEATRTGRKQPISHQIGKSIVAKCCDGKWHSSTYVAEMAGVTPDEVHRVMTMMTKYPTHGAKAERKRVGQEHHYRIFKQNNTVSAHELATKLRPIVEGLKAEGKKNMATMVPAEVAMLTARLERLLNEWAE